MTPDQAELLANKLRAELHRKNSPDHKLAAPTLRRVIQHIGHVDIAVDAMLMYPRPLWLVEIAGAHWITPGSHELDDTRDIATPEEWGGLG